MDYESGEVYLDSRKKEMIAYAILDAIRHIAEIRNELQSLGLGTRALDWDLENYEAILKLL